MRGRRLLWVAATGAAVLAALTWVDLRPKVESDFFFSPDDPQLRTTQEIEQRFPGAQQIIVRAASPDPSSDAYLAALADLSSALQAVPGVTRLNSVTTERVGRSPLWTRLLLTPAEDATNVILTTETADPEAMVAALEGVLTTHERPDFALQMSGVPVIVELIRSSLFRDLRVFSVAALVVFGLLTAVIYRRAAVVWGTLLASGLACSLTLLIDQGVGLSIGLLTANIVTIVFVLTLSHVVFLTANARRWGAQRAIHLTFPASFWAMATTLLGFLSLTIASARPLRELGMAGAIGTVVSILCAYLLFPAFLPERAESDEAPTPTTPDHDPRRWEPVGATPPPAPTLPHPPASSKRGLAVVAALFVSVAFIGLGIGRVDTDPVLLSYFKPGTELREGLEAVDQDGGSSTLEIVVRDRSGGRLDEDESIARLWAFQDSLESMAEVGVVVSAPVLIGHARLQPLAGFLSTRQLADILESPAQGRIGRAFLSSDRQEARFLARMHEAERTQTRADIIEGIRVKAAQVGLQPVLVGGVYELQGQLGRLIASSLRLGLGGLLLLFIGIGLVVSRSGRVTGVMFACLLSIPLVVLGTFGHLRIPIDMITSPAANVALALGVDSMIHLVLRARALGDWNEARRQMTQPVLAATLIIAAGFGLFGLSTFPPTARFGLAVMLGTTTAATMALLVLPTVGRHRLAGALIPVRSGDPPQP